ncbi:hypothetical protein SK128_008954 [Halocaridina rubra]|uniref:Pentraxin (PTX) domain-containing protein n=1 Tax=Halocaridina rubra TaxID=373956 RepID=A0AAN8X3K1_HALRR
MDGRGRTHNPLLFFAIFIGGILTTVGTIYSRQNSAATTSSQVKVSDTALLAGKKEWLLEFADRSEVTGGHMVMIEFQEDGLETTDSWMMLNQSIPDLTQFSLCVWVTAFYWRTVGTFLSYALSTEKDNYLYIELNDRHIEMDIPGMADVVILLKGETSTLERYHICIVVDDAIQVYLNGAPTKVCGDEKAVGRKSPQSLPALQGKGSLVLGQDQDKPSGGYFESDSFSGSLTDFHIFPLALSSREVEDLYHCNEIKSKSLVNFTHSNWIYSNVAKSTIARLSICNETVNGVFIFFNQLKSYDEAKLLCEVLESVPPKQGQIDSVLNSAVPFFQRGFASYKKMHTHIDTEIEGHCLDMTLFWEPGIYLKARINIKPCGALSTWFICNKSKQKYLRLKGIPKKMKDRIDGEYQLLVHNGQTKLQGTKKSYIILDEEGWCMYGLGNLDPLLCYPSTSDFPPMGRKVWYQYNDNITTLMVLTSCSEAEFTCDSGQCINLIRRCDTRYDCPDKSDENKCRPIAVHTDQLASLRSVPHPPLRVSAKLSVVNIPIINLESNDFVMHIWINITWTDERLTFLNLANDSLIYVDEQYFKEYVWVPCLHFRPIERRVSDLKTIASVEKLCDGEPLLLDSMEENKYRAQCTEFLIRTCFQVIWQCRFNIPKFPFETVFCPLVIELDDRQVWDDNVTVEFPVFDHLPYEAS